jgi:hypothetical protein
MKKSILVIYHDRVGGKEMTRLASPLWFNRFLYWIAGRQSRKHGHALRVKLLSLEEAN